MSYLQVADGSVSTRDECDGRDAQGYPRTARRRLRKNHDDAGTVTDIDTGQRFKVRKTKEGDRIVPLFDKQVYWKSASGYDALRLCLSCLGAPGEYVLWDEVTGAEMTREEWCKRKFVNKSKPAIRHSCGQVIQTTAISQVQQGGSIGCTECVLQLRVWSERFAEFTKILPNGYTLELTEQQWKERATKVTFCPPIRCTKHKITTSSTSIANIQRGQGIGCPKCHPKLNPWSMRYSKFVSLLRTGFTLQMTEAEWKEQCTGAFWCPPIHCNLHKTVSQTSRIADLARGEGVGCPKCVPLLARKTEATVLKWLESAFPTATIAREVDGPGRTHFDFVLALGDDHIVLEVDGPQHFWKDNFMYKEGYPERDAEKARWALARGQWVVRVLANDVYHDRNGWRAWLRRAIDETRAGAATTGAPPRVLTPDAPEYRSPESAYIDPHANDTNA